MAGTSRFGGTSGGDTTEHRHHAIDYVEITVVDVEAAKAFGIRAPDGAASQEAGGLALGTSPATGGPLVLLYSDDLDATVTAVRAAGGAIVTEPYAFPGGRRFHVTDPGGTELGVWSPA